MLLLAWLVLVGAFAAITTRSAIERAREELNATGVVLHRVISQRASQHDAHLTSLIALVLAATPPPQDAIRMVAQNIIRFYPRITAISLVELAESGTDVALVPLVPVPPDNGVATRAPFAGSVFQQRPGQARTYFDPARPGLYLLAKKANQANPALAIFMEVDPALLAEPGEQPDWARMMLSLGDQTILDRPAEDGAQQSPWLGTPRFSRMIDSVSQPFLLTLERPLALADVIRLPLILGFAAVSLAVLLMLHYAWRQRRAARLSARLAQAAEQRTELLARETRLAHASRVNSLGELASGIAHELTQPLTALLSQSQAAARLAATGQDPALLRQALEANVREAKRAGQMLARMRDYISNRPPRRAETDIDAVVADICDLVRADLEGRGIELRREPSAHPLVAVVDAVELEQVLHNLIRNAADALATQPHDRRITVSTQAAGETVVIRVADTGPGIPPDVRPRLFEPFFTTKAEGMGLGLSLCATLVERAGGAIEAGTAEGGGALFTLTFPAAGRARQAAQ
ncbi:MAG: GHKL domain-containing protein [Rhizobiales bacterium]|nr:GHKL domain-containing protein [Hyphomicrobiales bacterium]